MSAGVYGKYPGKRDFVVTNVPRSVLSPLETWLQGGMAASRQTLGRSWEAHYLVQPIWSFWIGGHVTGVDCAGAIVPSVDRVGRHFPLVILGHAEGSKGGYAPWHRVMTSDWLKSVHERLLSALGDNPPSEQAALIDGLGDPEESDSKMPESALPAGGGFRVIGTDTEASAAGTLDRIHLITGDKMRSILWTGGSDLVPPQIGTFIGMPDIYFMASMMSYDRNAI
jgi:type VI secretion system protein ImpM